MGKDRHEVRTGHEPREVNFPFTHRLLNLLMVWTETGQVFSQNDSSMWRACLASGFQQPFHDSLALRAGGRFQPPLFFDEVVTGRAPDKVSDIKLAFCDSLPVKHGMSDKERPKVPRTELSKGSEWRQPAPGWPCAHTPQVFQKMLKTYCLKARCGGIHH